MGCIKCAKRPRCGKSGVAKGMHGIRQISQLPLPRSIRGKTPLFLLYEEGYDMRKHVTFEKPHPGGLKSGVLDRKSKALGCGMGHIRFRTWSMDGH